MRNNGETLKATHIHDMVGWNEKSAALFASLHFHKLG